jgi:WD40 repeat protein
MDRSFVMPGKSKFAVAPACCQWLICGASLLLLASSSLADENRPSSTAFFVIDKGTALLGPEGEEIERLSDVTYGAGALSPDGKWIVFSEARKEEPSDKEIGEMLIQSRRHPDERTTVPLVWGSTGSSFLPLWSADSRRILICEQGWRDKMRESAYRIYDLTAKELTELELPAKWWPSDWSPDGKRLLTSLETGHVAGVNIDGTGEPEIITRELEVVHGARLSPDGKRILCLAGLRRPNERRPLRLTVIDLVTKKGKRIDEPGETHGFCWSPDGSRIAYTWQPTLKNPEDVAIRETFLITCDPDGGDRKTVTSRKREISANSSGRGGTVIFFQALAWR